MVEKIIAISAGLYIPFVDGLDFLVKLFYRAKTTTRGNKIWPSSVREVPEDIEALKDPADSIIRHFMVKPYKVVVSVHNIAETFEEFKNNMEDFGYENVLVIDDASSDVTRHLLRKENFDFLSNNINLQKSASILKGIRSLPREIETIIIIDPDARILNLNSREYGKRISDIEEVISDFQKSGYEGCAVRVLAECQSLLEYLQNFEYKTCMSLAKKSLQGLCMTSGAFAIFKRNFIERVLTEHSKSVYGEDYETSLRILAAGGHIYYDGRLTVVTKQKKNLWDLTRQRMGWDLSLLKIQLLMMKRINFLTKNFISFYHYVIYNTIISIVLHPIRLVSIALLITSFLNIFDNLFMAGIIPDRYYSDPRLFGVFYISYVMIAYATLFFVERRRRDRYIYLLPLYPFYVLYLGLVPRTLGYLNFISLKIFKRKVVEDGYMYT